MAKTILGAGHTGPIAVSAPTVYYYNLSGYLERHDTETRISFPVGASGKCTKLVANISENSVTGGTGNGPNVFIFRKNASDGNLTFSVPQSTTGWFEDTSNQDIVTQGDLICVKMTPASGSSGSINLYNISCVYDTNSSTSSTISHHVIVNGPTANAYTGSGTTYFLGISGYLTNTPLTTESRTQHKIQIGSTTLKRLHCKIDSNSRTNNTVLRLRKNGANGNMVITITSGATGTFIDTTNTDSVAVNDLINYSITNGSGTESILWNKIAMISETTTDPGTGMLPSFRENGVELFKSDTRYFQILGESQASTFESSSQLRTKETWTFKRLEINVVSNNIRNNSTFTLRKNATDTALSVSITAQTSGWFQNTSNTVAFAVDDLVSLILVGGGGGGASTLSMFVYNFGVYTEIAGDASGPTQSKTIADSITLTHSTGAQRMLIQLRSDNITFSESIPRIRGLNQLSSDSITLSENIPRLRGLNQASSDSITISDSESRLRGLARLRADSVAFTEDIVKDMIDRVRMISDSLTLSDSSSRLRLLLQTSSDSLGLSESIARLRNKVKVPNQDVLYFLRFDEELDDWVEGLEINRLTGKIRSTSESLGLTESMDRLRGKARILSESVGFSHDLSRLTNRIKTISDIISLISDTVRERMKTGLVSESLEFTESVNRLTTRLKTISESLTLSDAVLRLRGLLQTGSDSISFSDNIEKLRNKVRVTSESLTLSSSTERLRLMHRLLDQSISLSDNLVYQTSRLRGFIQNLSLSEVIETGGANIIRNISETLDLTHGAERTTNRLRTISESLGLTDSISRIRTKLTIMSHSVTLSETISQSKEFMKTISETLSLTDSDYRLVNRIRTFSDSLSFSSELSRLKSKLRLLSQTLSLTDSFVQDALSSVIKTISEELTFSDGAERAKGQLKTISNAFSLASDTIKSKPHRIKVISQTLNISDSTSRLRLFIMRNISQNLGFSSTLFRETKSAIKNFTIEIRRFKLFRYS